MIVKLISENYKVCYQSKIDPKRLVSSRTSTILVEDLSKVKGYVVGFGCLLGEETLPKDLIKHLLASKYQVIYVTDQIPKSCLVHPNLIYVLSEWQWFTHTCFLDYQLFNGVFYSGKRTKQLAYAFSKLTPFECPVLENSKQIKLLQPSLVTVQSKTPSLLVDTVSFTGGRGLGDVLMTTVLLKYLSSKWVIDYYIRPNEAPVLQHNPYIRQILTGKENDLVKPNIKSYDWHFILANYLEEYRDTPRNRQCRLYSLCELFHIHPREIKDWIPVLHLTEEEIEFGKQFRSTTKPTLVVGLESTGSEKRSYPKDRQLVVLSELSHIFHIVLTSAYKWDLSISDVTNLTGQLNLRQFFSVINSADMILSSDTSVYWVGLAFKKPSVVIFSSIEPDWRVAPYSDLIYPIYLKMRCQPCWERQAVRDVKAWEDCRKSLESKGVTPCILVDPAQVVTSVKQFSIMKKIL